MLGRPATPPTTPPSATYHNMSPCPAFRNLGPELLAGVIFTCTDDSFDDCLKAGVFGLPRNHFQYVQYVRPSMVLFLFNFNTRELHGIFRAVTQGKLDGRPGGVDSHWASNFPAQVYVDTSDRYPPLPEAAFKLAIIDNYHSTSSSQFAFELDTEQVARISELFKKFSSATRVSRSPQLTPLVQSPTLPVQGNEFTFNDGVLGNRSPSGSNIWDALSPSAWGLNEVNPSNLQAGLPEINHSNLQGGLSDINPSTLQALEAAALVNQVNAAQQVAALNAQLAPDLSPDFARGYGRFSTARRSPPPVGNVFQATSTPVHDNSPYASNLEVAGLALNALAQSPMHADTSPVANQLWATLGGGSLSPVMASTPNVGTPSRSTTPTGVWGQQTIWSARPGDPFGGLSWSSSQVDAVQPGAGTPTETTMGVGFQDPVAALAAISSINPEPTVPSIGAIESEMDRRGWGSLLDGSGMGLVELRGAEEGNQQVAAANADQLVTFGSLVANGEQIEALNEMNGGEEREENGGEGGNPPLDGGAVETEEYFAIGGAKEGWQNEKDLITHGWSQPLPDAAISKDTDDEEEPPIEDRMLERISSLPRIKTGRASVDYTAMVEEALRQQANGVTEDKSVDPSGREGLPGEAQHSGVVGGSGAEVARPSGFPPAGKQRRAVGSSVDALRRVDVPDLVRPNVAGGGRERGTEKLQGENKEGGDGSREPPGGTNRLHSGERSTAPEAPKLVGGVEMYKNAIDSLSSVVRSLKAENAELRKDRDSIKVQLERSQMRLFLMRDQEVNSNGGMASANNHMSDLEAAEGGSSPTAAAPPPLEPQQPPHDLWVMGGIGSRKRVCRQMEVFQPDRNEWFDGPKLPMGLCYGAAVAHGPYVFVLGGVDTEKPHKERANMWNINLKTGINYESPSMMTHRTKLGAAEIGGKIYAIGGCGTGRTLRTVEIYDPMHDCWFPGLPLNHARRAFGTAVVDGSIYVVGGISKNTVVDTVEMLDPREGKWQVVGELSESRGALACAPIRGNLLVMGGYNDGNVLKTVEMLDVRARSSVAVPNMRQGRSYCTATTIGGEIFVVGGRVSVDDNNEELAEMERFDIEEMAWKDRAVAGQLGTRAFHAACAVKREA
ncbi:hypothetical protein BSKO_05927 [Bryopsis sp. KO-2023]|nr:hypothetical protein BSKO_05927 [Bryopsis sp. KO-2023]